MKQQSPAGSHPTTFPCIMSGHPTLGILPALRGRINVTPPGRSPLTRALVQRSGAANSSLSAVHFRTHGVG